MHREAQMWGGTAAPQQRDSPIQGCVALVFTPLREAHIADWGPAFIPSLHIFSWSPCAWLPLLLNLEASSCTQDSEKSFVCLDVTDVLVTLSAGVSFLL